MQHQTSWLWLLLEAATSSFLAAVPSTWRATTRAQHSMPASHTRQENADQQSCSSRERSLRPAASRLLSKRLLFGEGGGFGVYLVLGQPLSSLSSLSFSARDTFPDKQPRGEAHRLHAGTPNIFALGAPGTLSAYPFFWVGAGFGATASSFPAFVVSACKPSPSAYIHAVQVQTNTACLQEVLVQRALRRATWHLCLTKGNAMTLHGTMRRTKTKPCPNSTEMHSTSVNHNDGTKCGKRKTDAMQNAPAGLEPARANAYA